MWETRFQAATSKNNSKVHEYYRVYFDKPPKKKQEHILLGNTLRNSYPNLHSSLEKISHRLPVKNKKAKVKKELEWSENFHVKTSKDNEKYYKDCREYFDSPVCADHRSGSIKNLRSPLITSREKLPKPPNLTQKFYWNPLYEPISERNVVKHASKRIYFS